jgi:hypothetical protein
MKETRLSILRVSPPSPLVQFLAALAIFIVLALITLEPNPSYMAADDFFALPERLWFIHRDLDWLYHLVNFSQARFNNVGGFSGLRPFLFFDWWAEDMAGRELRGLFHQLCVATGIAWAATTYLLLRRYIGFVLSTAVAAILLIAPGVEAYSYFMSWPELNAYGVALALFNVGLLLLPTEHQTRGVPVLLLAVFSFVIAGLNHEFVIPALLVMTVLHAGWIWYDRRNGRRSATLRQTFAVVASASVILCVIALIHFMLSKFTQPLSWATLQPLPISLFRLSALIVMPLLPQNIGDAARVIVPVVLAAIVAILFAVKALAVEPAKVFVRLRDPAILGAVSAFIAIVVAVFVGRIVTDGYTPTWYYRFLSAYEAIMLAAASTVVVVRRVALVRTICLVLAAYLAYGFGRQIYTVHMGNRAIYEANHIAPVVAAIRQQILQNPGWCYAGVWPRGISPMPDFNPRPRDMALDNPAAVAAITTMLQFYSCAERGGEPTYFAVSGSGDVQPMKASAQFAPSAPPATPAAVSGPAIAFPEPLFEVLGPNIWDYRQTRDPHPYGTVEWDGLTRRDVPWRGSVIANLDGNCPCDIRMAVKSDDKFPRMYNLGLVFGYGQPGATALLLFENQVVLGRLERDKLRITSLGFIPDMRAPLDLFIRFDDNGCMVFANRQLVASDPDCKLHAGGFGTFSWPNGTPAERIADLSVVEHAGAGPILIPVRFLIFQDFAAQPMAGHALDMPARGPAEFLRNHVQVALGREIALESLVAEPQHLRR